MSNRTLYTAALLATLLCCFCIPSHGEAPPAADLKTLEEIAADAVSLATEFADAGIMSKAEWAVSVCTAAIPDYPGVAELRERLAEVEDEGDETPDEPPIPAELEKKEKAFRKSAAASYLKLYTKKGKALSDRCSEYLARALELQPTDKNAWKKALGEVKDRDGQKEFLATYIPRLLTVPDAPRKELDAIIEVEKNALTSGGVLRKATGHDMLYFISLPRKWTSASVWPVLLTVEGAGCGFAGNHKGFVGKRGDLPLIVITMHTFSNTNALEPGKYQYSPEVLQANNAFGSRIEFDSQGAYAVMADIQKMYRADTRFAVTGFSGGGNLTYFLALHRPELLTAALPACANFNPGLAQGISEVTDDAVKQLPIMIFTGEKDPHRDAVHGKEKPGIEGQTDNAIAAMEGIGLSNIKRTMLAGVGHSACQDQVMTALKDLPTTKATTGK